MSVIKDMEERGVLVDKDFLKELNKNILKSLKNKRENLAGSWYAI